MQLNHWQDVFAKMQVQVAAITIDNQREMLLFTQSVGITFPILKDPRGAYAHRYGIRSKQYGRRDLQYGVPHPGVIYVFPDGVVAAKAAVPGYRARPPFEALAKLVMAAQVDAGLPPPQSAEGQ